MTKPTTTTATTTTLHSVPTTLQRSMHSMHSVRLQTYPASHCDRCLPMHTAQRWSPMRHPEEQPAACGEQPWSSHHCNTNTTNQHSRSINTFSSVYTE